MTTKLDLLREKKGNFVKFIKECATKYPKLQTLALTFEKLATDEEEKFIEFVKKGIGAYYPKRMREFLPELLNHANLKKDEVQQADLVKFERYLNFFCELILEP